MGQEIWAQPTHSSPKASTSLMSARPNTSMTSRSNPRAMPAVGGTVNLVSKVPRPDDLTIVSAAVGTHDYFRATADSNHPRQRGSTQQISHDSRDQSRRLRRLAPTHGSILNS